MQIKHLLVALLVLLALVGTAAAADSVEIRSTIIHADDLSLPTDQETIDATNWAGLYYNLDTGANTEKLIVKRTYDGGTKKDQINVTYTTSPAFQKYEYDGWTTTIGGTDYQLGYAIIGFFAEPYVAFNNKSTLLNENDHSAPGTILPGVKADKIAKLVTDNDDKYTLKTGATLEIGSGYSLIVDQIDVEGDKAYLKVLKDGKELNTSIVNAAGESGGDWIFDINVLGEKNTQVLRVHVKDVFQGTESSLVEIEGIWAIDYLEALEIKSGVDFGKFEEDGVGSSQLQYEASNISLSADSETDLGRGIFVKTEKDFAFGSHDLVTPADDHDKFYFFKEYTEPGTYEIRSSVKNYAIIAPATAPVVGPFTDTFDYESFAAFFYDIDSNAETEELEITFDVTGSAGSWSVKVAEDNLTYSTEPTPVDYEYSGWNTTSVAGTQYYVMGFFGEKFVPLNLIETTGALKSSQIKPEKMAKLVLDNDDKYTLKTGATLELGEGYSVVVDQIDVEGDKAYLRFMKDGKELNSSIVNANATNGGDWFFRANVLSEKDSQVLRVHVKDVFQGTQDSLVEIEGLWLMDYQNAKEVKTDDKYGILEYDGLTGNKLVFRSDTNFTMQSDMDKQIANNMYLKTADNDTALTSGSGARYYFYVEAEVGEGTPVDPQPPVDPSQPTTPTEKPPVVTPTEPDVPDQPDDKEPGWFSQNWKLVVGILVLIIIIAGAAYYFMVYKKQA